MNSDAVEAHTKSPEARSASLLMSSSLGHCVPSVRAIVFDRTRAMRCRRYDDMSLALTPDVMFNFCSKNRCRYANAQQISCSERLVMKMWMEVGSWTNC